MESPEGKASEKKPFAKLHRLKGFSAARLEIWKKKMNMETLKISSVIKKPPDERTTPELDEILPYLTKRSELLGNLQKESQAEVLHELIKHCRHKSCMKDDVIIKQGTIGDCFYIILTGHTSVYIDTVKSDEDAPVERKSDRDSFFDDLDALLGIKPKTPKVEEVVQVNRSDLGKFIMFIESGKSFGEVALLSDNAERNASIVADMDNMDLLVVDKDLYDRTVKERQMAEYKDKRDFINSHPLFKNWAAKFKRLLEMSLIKETYSFDNIIAKQGQNVDGLYFIISGHAKLIVEPAQHKSQYTRLLQSNNNGTKSRQLAQNIIHVKRKFGYAEAEKRQTHRVVELSYLKERDVFGDLESIIQLSTYMGTLQCTSQVTVLHVNTKNFDRLVTKKNPKTQEIFKEITFKRVSDMLMTKVGESVPLLKTIYDKFIYEEEPPEAAPRSKPRDKDDKEFLTSQLLQLYTEGKMQLFEPLIPDSVYFMYKSAERRKRDVSARERILREQRDNSVNGRLRTLNETRKRALSGNGRRPRSRRELNNLTLDDFKASLDTAAKYKNYTPDKKPKPPSTAPAATHTTKSVKQNVRPATSKARLGGNYTGLQTISEGSDSNQPVDRMSNSDGQSRGSSSPVPHKIVSSRQTAGDQLIVTGSESEKAEQNRLADAVQAWIDHNNGATTQNVILDTREEKLLQEQIDNDEVLRSEVGDSPLITLFNVMEVIQERRQAKKTLSRPKSAPTNQLYRSQGSIDSDFVAPEYFDDDTSNNVLSSLEDRLRKFHMKITDEDSLDKPLVTQLRRFDMKSVGAPVAGGTVFVKLKPCKHSTGPETVDHNHTRRYILPRLKSYYNSVQISKNY